MHAEIGSIRACANTRGGADLRPLALPTGMDDSGVRLSASGTRSAVSMAPAGGSSPQCESVFDLIAEKVKEVTNLIT
jgi:hypothetical protein